MPPERADCRHEEIGRNGKNEARLERTSEIDQRDQRQDAKAKFERIRVQLRDGRGQRADPGRDPHRDIENVVDHQGAGGEQPGVGLEIFLRDGVRAAVARIGLNGLPVGEVEQCQKDQDDRHDRADQVQAFCSQRDHDRQRGLRTVGRGAEPVQTHRRNAFERSDLAPFPLLVRQPSPDHNTGKIHDCP